jgi:tetratricopeptide (TPR) repeat protein
MNRKVTAAKKWVDDEERELSAALAQCLSHVKDFMTDSQKANIIAREGKAIMDSGDIKGAIECFNEGISYNPTTTLFNLRAVAHKLLEMYTEAYFDYSYNIRLEPENGTHYCNRGLCLAKLKKIAMALEDFEVAIQFEPSASHYYSRATTYAEFGKYDLAIAGKPRKDPICSPVYF